MYTAMLYGYMHYMLYTFEGAGRRTWEALRVKRPRLWRPSIFHRKSLTLSLGLMWKR